MSDSTGSRRAVAELRTGGDAPTWSMIGRRSLHQYWPVFSAQFRGVLLPPQRRPDSGDVSWSWREAAVSDPLSPPEFADVRRRLEKADRSFASQASDPVADEEAEEDGPLTLGNKISVSVHTLVEMLVTASDAELAGFVCRADSVPMVHSWGATVPARPFYPDALEYAISGAVFMGAESAAGLTVVLENRQGAILARVQTDSSGTFDFQKIGPGNYRIRVLERGDFPATGFAVTVERQSIVGLELHRGAAVATFAGRSSPATPLPIAPADPALVGAGSALHPVRARAGWRWARRVLIPLAAFVSLALIGGWWRIGNRRDGLVPPAGPALSWWGSTRDRLAGFFNHSASPPAEPARTAPGAPGAGRRMDPPDAARRSIAQGGVRNVAPAAPQRGMRPERTAREISGTRLGVSRGAEPAKDGSDAGAADADAPAGMGGVAGDARTAPAVAAASKMGKVGQSSGGGAGRGAGNREEEVEAESNPTKESLVAGPEAAGGSPATVGHFLKSSAARQNRPMSSVAAASHSPPSPALVGEVSTALPALSTESADAPARVESSVLRSSGKSRQVASRPTAAGATPTLSASARNWPEAMADDDDVTETSATRGEADPVRRIRATAVAARPVAVSTPDISLADPMAPGSFSPPPELVAVDPARRQLPQRHRLVVVAFQPRLVQDIIVPTQPVREGAEDGIERSREEMLRERRARMPRAFKNPITTSGFILEFPPGDLGSGPEPCWRNATGEEVVGASVYGNRTEVSWAGRPSPGKPPLILTRPDGRALARVEVASDGAAELATMADARVWFWIGVDLHVDEPASASGVEPDLRLDWRFLSGGSLPAAWRRDDRWRDGRGYRLDVPLTPGATGRPLWALILADPASGWGMAGEIGQP